MGYMNGKKSGKVGTSSLNGSGEGPCKNSYSGCVQGIKDELSSLINQTVRIDTQNRSYVGVVTSVTCDVVRLGASTGTVATIISICKIEAVIPTTTTVVVTEINLDDTDIANKV